MTAYFLRLNSDKNQRSKYKELYNRKVDLKLYLFNKKKTTIKKRNKIITPIQKPIFQPNTHCFMTGASKSVYKKFSLSRHALRHFLNRGYFPMCGQSSW